MENLYINDSGHAMDEIDINSYIRFKEVELMASGLTDKELKEFIDSFFDDRCA